MTSVRRCPACGHESAEAGRYCPECAAPIAGGAEPLTRTSISGPSSAGPARSPGSPSSSAASLASSPSGGRFLPGATLAGRYRIFGLIGRGGMGEVYRADDLKLGQQVALKFLPKDLEADGARLARLLAEVRIARQISHPSVCRVYDVAEADGHHFLSMEFVDGEDLASLLRRIGRLPQDKAVQIARQICAGLAAAHDQGVLHRDLKPANIMIDGRGRARITDFGLAGTLMEEGDAAAGTPAYMAPEQLAGKSASVRTDLYALGLVLYELFTGKPAWRADTLAELVRVRHSSAPSLPSSLVPNLDTAVERAILRCLEENPAQRPRSAMSVAASLPGGDPLAAALAAGETPSPEMVAEAGEAGGLKPWVAACLFGAYLLGVLASIFPVVGVTLMPKTPLEKPPDALEAEARNILERVGHTATRTDSARGFSWDTDHYEDVKRNGTGADRWDVLAASRPSPLFFWYRQSPRPLVPWSRKSVTASDPPLHVSGMAYLSLDPKGRLLGLNIVPPQREDSPLPTAREDAAGPDWTPLFGMASLDISKFHPAGSIWNLPFDCDARFAWTGAYDDRPNVPIRVEAASWRGKAVSFWVIPPWTKPGLQEQPTKTMSERAIPMIIFSLLGMLLGVGMYLARRNLRLGRGDKKGAFRLAVFLFVIYLGSSVLKLHHVADWDEVSLLARAAADALFYSGMVWLVYIALEPYVRRFWPEVLISWSRLLSGRLRDPRVGRDVLIGGVAGVLFVICGSLRFLLPAWLGRTPTPPILPGLATLSGLGSAFGHLLQWLDLSPPVFILFIVLLARLTLRNQWAALGAITALWTALIGLQSTNFVLDLAIFVPLIALILYVLMRCGLLAMVAMGLLTIEPSVPVSLSSWYAGAALLQPLLAVVIAAFAFRISLAGRPLFGSDLLGDGAPGRSPAR